MLEWIDEPIFLGTCLAAVLTTLLALTLVVWQQGGLGFKWTGGNRSQLVAVPNAVAGCAVRAASFVAERALFPNAAFMVTEGKEHERLPATNGLRWLGHWSQQRGSSVVCLLLDGQAEMQPSTNYNRGGSLIQEHSPPLSRRLSRFNTIGSNDSGNVECLTGAP